MEFKTQNGRISITHKTIIPEETGANIRRIRISRGYSVKDVQFHLNLDSAQAVYKWEKGQSLPNLDNLTDLCFFLNVSLDEILVYRTYETYKEPWESSHGSGFSGEAGGPGTARPPVFFYLPACQISSSRLSMRVSHTPCSRQ